MTELIHQMAIKDIPLNLINRTNTWKNTGIKEITKDGYRFAVGLWPTLNQNTGEPTPIPVLIVWTSSGWKTLAVSFAFWDTTPNDGVFDIDIDVDVDGDEDADDLKSIMWYLEGVFNPAIDDFLASAQPGSTKTIPVGEKDWRNIDTLIKTASFNEKGKLVFSWSL